MASLSTSKAWLSRSRSNVRFVCTNVGYHKWSNFTHASMSTVVIALNRMFKTNWTHFLHQNVLSKTVNVSKWTRKPCSISHCQTGRRTWSKRSENSTSPRMILTWRCALQKVATVWSQWSIMSRSNVLCATTNFVKSVCTPNTMVSVPSIRLLFWMQNTDTGNAENVVSSYRKRKPATT